LRRLAWLVIPLLLLGLAANYEELARALRGETTVREALSADPRAGLMPDITVAIPEDRGARDAKVRLEVFLVRTGACTCHVETAALGEAMAAVDPNRLRVAFLDLADAATEKRMKALGAPLPCAGFAINARYKFRVPTSLPGREKTREVDFLAADRNWTFEDVYEAWAQEYRAAYGKPPAMTRDVFVKRVSAKVQPAYEAAMANAGVPGLPKSP